MTTVRQLERDWNAKNFDKLFRELTAARPEAAFRFEFEAGRSAPAVAMGIIRVVELNQSHVPLYARLVRAVLAAQDPGDGGWGDPVVTALCCRALLADKGQGVGLERGLGYFSELQKPDGAWPAVSVRRLPEDSYVSAFILSQLGDQPKFRDAVRFDDAIEWFDRHAYQFDADTKALWARASLRCGANRGALSTRQAAMWG